MNAESCNVGNFTRSESSLPAWLAYVPAGPHRDGRYCCSGSHSSAQKTSSIGWRFLGLSTHLLHRSLPGCSVSTFLPPPFLLWFVQWQHLYPFFFLTLFMFFFGTFSPAKLSTVSLELSPVRMTAQCNELCVFSLFSCNFCLCRLLFQPFSSSLERCPLGPPPCHLL